jgi:hypothetical protein
MKRSDDLFQLIKSLSRNERRYFRLFSQLQKGDKEYINLFDSLDKLSVYDEKIFREKNKGKEFVSNLAWRKHHLYNLILKSLESYHESIDTEVYALLHRNEILFEKGLYKQCKKILAKAKQIAKKYEMYHIIFEILNWEDMISIKVFDVTKQASVIEESKQNIKLLSNLTDYKNILQEIYSVHHVIGVFRKQEDQKPLSHILTSKLWKDESQALTFKAKRHYYYSHFLYCFMKGDYENGYLYTKKCVDSFFTQPEQIAHSSHFYITAVNAFLYCCTHLKKHNEMIDYIMRVNEAKKLFTKRSERAEAVLLSYHELGYYMMTGKLQKGLEAAKRIEREIMDYDDILAPLEKFSLYINLAFLYFMAEKYKDAIAWLYKIISAGALKARNDMESMIRIFYIIAQYEKGSSKQFMKSLLRSTYRMLVKREQLYKYEKIILDFIRKELVKVDTREDLIDSLKDLREQLLIISKDPYEGRPLEYFDLISWITSKIENRSFAELTLEKNK